MTFYHTFFSTYPTYFSIFKCNLISYREKKTNVHKLQTTTTPNTYRHAQKKCTDQLNGIMLVRHNLLWILFYTNKFAYAIVITVCFHSASMLEWRAIKYLYILRTFTKFRWMRNKTHQSEHTPHHTDTHRDKNVYFIFYHFTLIY